MKKTVLGIERLESRETPSAAIWAGEPGAIRETAYQVQQVTASVTTFAAGIETADDVDLYAVTLRRGQELTFEMNDTWNQKHYQEARGLLAHMIVFNRDGRFMHGGPHQGPKALTWSLKARYDGVYYIGISANWNGGYSILDGHGALSPKYASIGNYTLSVWTPNQSPSPIAWGKRVSPAFAMRVREIANNLGVDPSWLMSVMAFESAETFSPSIKNGAGSGAVGLIQFMPTTAESLGTTTTALREMTALRQLDYVERYFAPYEGRLTSLDNTYMAVLYPKAIGKSGNYVLFHQGTKAYSQNAGLDTNNDGSITKTEAAAQVRAKLTKGSLPGYIG